MHLKNMESSGLNVTFLDLETTSKNPNSTEILTAYLRTRRVYDWSIVDDIYLTFKPQNYLDDSFEIHGISRKESSSFCDKWESFRSLLGYMYKHRDSLFCCHANHLLFGVYGYFDSQVIMQVAHTNTVTNGSRQYYWYLQQRFKFISTHTITRYYLHLDNYRLKTIADYFKVKYDPHTAKGDVFACEEIFRKQIDKEITEEELLKIADYKYKMEEYL